jgi:hypothetical protein
MANIAESQTDVREHAGAKEIWRKSRIDLATR